MFWPDGPQPELETVASILKAGCALCRLPVVRGIAI